MNPDYEHPEWQRKRLRIMERDGFRCKSCDDKTTQLHVHHLYYVGGRRIWDYPDLSLTTLCKPCHEGVRGKRCDWESIFAILDEDDILTLIVTLQALKATTGRTPKELIESLSCTATTEVPA
jgi:hypothetical protein